jgi:flagellar M-ring protein FliF
MLGTGNFSSEIQVDLDMDQQTSARESYDKQGVVRSETQTASQTTGNGARRGPGVLPHAPAPDAAFAGRAYGQYYARVASRAEPDQQRHLLDPQLRTGSRSRRHQCFAGQGPPPVGRRRAERGGHGQGQAGRDRPDQATGQRRRRSRPTRGDQVTVVVRNFQPTTVEQPKFWETPWFAMMVRNGVALLAVLLTLLLGVRPLIKALRRDQRRGQNRK